METEYRLLQIGDKAFAGKDEELESPMFYKGVGKWNPVKETHIIDENSPVTRRPLSLADLIFEGGFAKMAVDEIVQNLADNSMEDSRHDYYDGSIELLFQDGFEGLTREQADKILELGFGMIYETIGNKGICWTEKGMGECNPGFERKNRKL